MCKAVVKDALNKNSNNQKEVCCDFAAAVSGLCFAFLYCTVHEYVKSQIYDTKHYSLVLF